jgi:hypothetical protein
MRSWFAFLYRQVIRPVPPQRVCRRLSLPDFKSWDANAAALQDTPVSTLGQSWRRKPQRRFLPASVRTGWMPGNLLVYAEMEDLDIFNPTTKLNASSYKTGDVFEIFLRPADQSSYCEFHISPQNQKFQLRIPSGAHFRSPEKDWRLLRSWMISDRQIQSEVRVDPAQHRWWVQAVIPIDMVADSGLVESGSRWLFSFGRYDYTHGRWSSVKSSSSPHRRLDFHRQEEWGTLTFE